jgi:ubiquinone/menaquinone biosynthesis C-methylase UbiE
MHHERSTRQHVRQRYTGKAQQEWDRLEANPITRIEYLITTHVLVRYLIGELARGAWILDVGCGPGRYAIDLARQGYRVVLCDLICDMLRLARRRVSESQVTDRVRSAVAADLAALPYADASFDAVLCLGAPLSHLIETGPRERAIHELARVARPGARLFLTGIQRLSAYRGGIFWGLWETWDRMTAPQARATGVVSGETVWYTFAPRELEGLAKEAGLRVLDRVGCEGLAQYLPMDRLAEVEAHPARGPVWREILLETCNEPSIVGASNHLLVVTEKWNEQRTAWPSSTG